MEHCIYKKDQYVILKTDTDYVVVNTSGRYENHSHFRYSLQAAKDCIRFVQNRIVPKRSRYMFKACLRLATDPYYIDMLQEYAEKSKDRDYINYTNLMAHDSFKRHKGALKRR